MQEDTNMVKNVKDKINNILKEYSMDDDHEPWSHPEGHPGAAGVIEPGLGDGRRAGSHQDMKSMLSQLKRLSIWNALCSACDAWDSGSRSSSADDAYIRFRSLANEASQRTGIDAHEIMNIVGGRKSLGAFDWKFGI